MSTDNAQPVTTQNTAQKKGTDSEKTLTMIIYALQAASFLLVITLAIAIIINYVKKNEVGGTWLESHFRWQIRTFWFALLWAVVGFVTLFFYIGIFILLANAIWVIYRIVKGGLHLNDNKEMYATT